MNRTRSLPRPHRKRIAALLVSAALAVPTALVFAEPATPALAAGTNACSNPVLATDIHGQVPSQGDLDRVRSPSSKPLLRTNHRSAGQPTSDPGA